MSVSHIIAYGFGAYASDAVKYLPTLGFGSGQMVDPTLGMTVPGRASGVEDAIKGTKFAMRGGRI